MQVQKLTAPELKVGRKYSMLFAVTPPLINAKFIRRGFCDDKWTFYFRETDGSERDFTLPGDTETIFEFITNEPQNYYILIGTEYLVGKFSTKEAAEKYYEENKGVIMVLYDNTEGKPDIWSEESISDLVASMFWINHDADIEIIPFRPIYFDHTKDRLEEYRFTK